MLDTLLRCCSEETVSQKVPTIPKNVAKYCRVAKWPKLLPPKYLFHYFLCRQSCSLPEVPCGQARCLRGACHYCLKPSSSSWPVLSACFYQRWIQISYLGFLFLTSWGILCIPHSDVAYLKEEGKWKALQHKSSFVHTWSILRFGSICHLKQLFFVFPYVKK